MFDGSFRKPIEKAIRPVGNALRKTGLTPDHLTIVGLLVGVGAAFAIGSGRLFLGLVLVVLAALPDLLDGALAKASGAASQRGAFFDSTVDRVTDALLLGGVAYYLAGHESPHMAVLPFAVMSASSLISYQRAKAESLGLDARGG
ncbi:MAG: CDP-alcohol phosphatidyltransferase family protein, partial [Actinomycetota bacterium]|nr:CDP-alcohol phosphatidyltransferase family protein [Actinomycetota bacterium]